MCPVSFQLIDLGHEISELAYWGGLVLRKHPRVRTSQGPAEPEIRHGAYACQVRASAPPTWRAKVVAGFPQPPMGPGDPLFVRRGDNALHKE